MTTSQATTMIKKLDTLIDIMSQKDSEWIRTKEMLRILRRGNPHIAKYVRENFMKPNDYRRDGLYYEYSVSAVHQIRIQADKNKIIIPK